MKKSGEHVRVNFGHTPFVFDIDSLMAVCCPDINFCCLFVLRVLTSNQKEQQAIQESIAQTRYV